METNFKFLVQQADALMGNLYTARSEYSPALALYKEAMEDLFGLMKSTSDPNTRNKTQNIIQHLLTKAETCKHHLNSSNPAPRPKSLNLSSKSLNLGRALLPKSNLQPHSMPNKPNPLAPYEAVIMNEIIDSAPSVRWDDIAGLESAKEMLQEAIIQPSLYPHLFTGIRAPPKGILLFGPPGTGKTMLAKAVASQCSATFFNITAAALTSKFFGEGEKMVRALFSVARGRQPSVVFIDEIDSILSSRSEGQHEASRRLETEFLVQMDGVNGNAEERVILIGATNRPQELDEAVRRRFTKRIYVDLPNGKAREDLILHLMSNVPYKLGTRDVKQLVKLTEGYSGSDLSALCKEAAMFPVRGLSHRELQEGRVPPVSLNHFKAAMEVIRPSVSKQSLNFYMRWNSEFGSRAG